MNKTKFLIIFSLTVFVVCFSIGSLSAVHNSTGDNLNTAADAESVEVLNAPEDVNSLSQCLNDNSTLSESFSDEKLDLSKNSSDDVLSSSVSVSSGHTFHKKGYTFKVSDYQYKMIKKAIKAGKKQTFLDWGFDFNVKTDKLIKVKHLVKKQTYYKKVRYERFDYPYITKTANLKNYYSQGWKKYNHKWVNGNHYAYLKKTVKTYKKVKMRVFANIYYVGEYDYVTGQHAYFPWVSFTAKRSGYSHKYLEGYLLTSY